MIFSKNGKKVFLLFPLPKNQERESLWFKNLKVFFSFLGVHLSNQNYDVCVRRKEGFCSLCWIPEEVGILDADPDMAGNQPTRGAFGLRYSPGKKVNIPSK